MYFPLSNSIQRYAASSHEKASGPAIETTAATNCHRNFSKIIQTKNMNTSVDIA